jgi:1-acyl-sn-glycerol-3-phosphate acyltransferase
MRRLRTVPTHLALFGLVTLLAPAWLVVGAIVDTVRWVTGRRHAIAVRIFAFGWWYLLTGVLGLFALWWHWLVAGLGRDVAAMRERALGLQAWWARRLFDAVVRVFRLTVTVEGLDRVAPGPVIVMMRHASIVDTLLPNVLVTTRAGIRLRYVLKRELLSDPLLDIAGNRLINHFVDREGDSSAEIRAVAALADGLAANEGVLIYPEGTRFTEARRDRIIAGLGARDSDLVERTRRLRRVLPPRPGGTVALLESGHDVVIATHTGLEPLATIPDAWSGRIVGSHLRIRFERFSAAAIPQTRRGRVEWLFDRWTEMDDWIGGG